MRALLLLLLLPGFLAMGQDKAAQIDELLSRYHGWRQFNGTALVAESGKVIYKKGFGLANMEWNIPNTPDTRFRLGSITKQFTAALILQLVQEGKIQLDDPMSKYVPDYPKKIADRVTVHHLLTHTSGIPSYTGLSNFMKDHSRDPYTPVEFLKIFRDLDFEFEPGSKFNYNNSGYFLLGVIIEKVTGKSYAEALQERIFGPLKMSSSGYDLHSPLMNKRAGAYQATLDGFENAPYLDMSIPYAAGSLHSTVEDLYLWDQALYTDQVVSAKSRDRMFTPDKNNYAYGWSIRKDSVPGGGERKVTIVGHGGGINGFNTIIERLVDDKHLVVLLNNTGGTRLTEMAQGIRNVLYGAPAKPPKPPVARALYQLIVEKDVAAAIQQCREWKKAETHDVNPNELATLANHLRRIKRAADAEQVAKLNVELHPTNPFAHVSLGDYYRETGNRAMAIRSYARAVELSPDEEAPPVRRLKEMLAK